MSNTPQATLISLTFSFGKTGGIDKSLTENVCTEQNASNKSLKVTKRTICKEALDPLRKLAGECRAKIARITTSWDIPGVCLCKPVNVAKVIAIRDEYFPAFDVVKASHVIENYETWKQMTREQNGDAFEESEFPSLEELQTSVTRGLSIMPLPESEILKRIKDIDATLIEELMKSNDERIQQGIAAGMAQAYTRLMEPLDHMVKVLSEDKPRIFESLVENVRNVVAEIPGLNLTDDSELSSFARQAEQMLSSIDAATLRSDPIVRKETADRAKAILSSFGAVGRRKFAA